MANAEKDLIEEEKKNLVIRFKRNVYEIELFYELFYDNKHKYNLGVKTQKANELKSAQDGTIHFIKTNGNRLLLDIFNCSKSVRDFEVPKNLINEYILFCKENHYDYKNYMNVYNFLDEVLKDEHQTN